MLMKRNRLIDNRRPIQLLLRWRWFVLAIAIPISIVIELVEGASHNLQLLDEVVIDGLILPLSTWAMLTFAAQKIALQFDREEALERRQRFTQQLAEYREYNDLIKFIVRFPVKLLPIEHATLLVQHEEQARLTVAAEWRNPDLSYATIPANQPTGNEYSIILIHNNKQIGILLLRCQSGAKADPNQLTFINLLVPEIAQALVLALSESQQAAQVYREAQAYERRRIMQELHDSLAQQVFYLHLGLDQLVDDGGQQMSEEKLQQKIVSMRDVAADVYEQIRNNLSILRAWEQVNLTEAISELARSTARNSDLNVNIDIQGEARWLSPHTCEHVFGVVREGLNNVVKHARAKHVQLQLHWTDERLSINLTDDGIGFEPTQHMTGDHYGLALMREAVEALQGNFSFTSQHGKGTSILISIPLRLPEPSLRPSKHLSEQLHTTLNVI
jgi:signal transduction histidine kinase